MRNQVPSNRDTKLIISRLLHLFELIQLPYNPGSIYSFKSEFKSKTAFIDGEVVFIWDHLSDEYIEEWKIRWIDKKTMTEVEYYTKYYNNFYRTKYQPFMNDLDKFLNRDPTVENPDFWEWYINTYTREHNRVIRIIQNLAFFIPSLNKIPI